MSPAPARLRQVQPLAEPVRFQRQAVQPLDQAILDTLRIDELRLAIRANQVTFPSPVPTFKRHDRADLQWRLVQLYFVLGWNGEGIAARYGLSRQRVQQILRTWKRRAVETGYIQFIPPTDGLNSVVRHAQTTEPVALT